MVERVWSNWNLKKTPLRNRMDFELTRSTVLTAHYTEDHGEITNFTPTKNMIENFIKSKHSIDDEDEENVDDQPFTFRDFDINSNLLDKRCQDAELFIKTTAKPRLNKFINLFDINNPNIVSKLPVQTEKIHSIENTVDMPEMTEPSNKKKKKRNHSPIVSNANVHSEHLYARNTRLFGIAPKRLEEKMITQDNNSSSKAKTRCKNPTKKSDKKAKKNSRRSTSKTNLKKPVLTALISTHQYQFY